MTINRRPIDQLDDASGSLTGAELLPITQGGELKKMTVASLAALAEGPMGPQGATGNTGAQGPMGPAGVQGPEGPAGPVGPDGPAGPQGVEGPVGPTGSQGSDGTPGDPGEGVAAGGTTGQVLAKVSDDDYDTEWVDQSGGGGGMENPMTTPNDLVIGGEDGEPTRLGVGITGDVLHIIEGSVVWDALWAGYIPYDNDETFLSSTSVQNAITELANIAIGVQVITEPSAFDITRADHSGKHRYIRAGGDITFAAGTISHAIGDVFNIRATAAIELIEDGITLNPPYGGTLELEEGMSVTVVMIDTDEGDVVGQTVAA